MKIDGTLKIGETPAEPAEIFSPTKTEPISAEKT